MTRRRYLWLILVWAGVWAFWLALTHSFHPTFPLALIVTTALVTAFATATELNRRLLIPRWWRPGGYTQYAIGLLVVMVLLTAVALAIIRVSYTELLGPDPDPNGAVKHFAIDLFGMACHLAAAAAVPSAWSRLRGMV
jgi:hypothetical protein